MDIAKLNPTQWSVLDSQFAIVASILAILAVILGAIVRYFIKSHSQSNNSKIKELHSLVKTLKIAEVSKLINWSII